MNAVAAISANSCGVDAQHHLGQQVFVAVLQRHRPRIAAQRGGLELGEHLGDMLERPVLQQAREQQVAHLQQGKVFLVVDLACGQQARRLQIQQGRRDHQERGGLVEFELRADRLGVGDEVVGHLVQRHLGDVEPVREDQLQQQVERTLEIAQPNLEACLLRLRRLCLGVHEPNRSMTSRANERYAWAPPDFGAQVVIGSPATLVSGKRTVRVITVSNTRSPNRSRRGP